MSGIVRVDGKSYRWMGAANGSSGETGVMEGIDIPGGDFDGMPFVLPAADSMLCQQACSANESCIAWAYGVPHCDEYSVPNCWLKGPHYGPKLPNKCRVSQVLRGSSDPGTFVNATAMQTDVSVFPTRTVYSFTTPTIAFNVTFATAAIPGTTQGDKLTARDVTYIRFSIASLDAEPHEVQIYTDVTAELVTDSNSIPVFFNSTTPSTSPTILHMGASSPQPITSIGSADRVHYGSMYFSSSSPSASFSASLATDARIKFTVDGTLPPSSTLQNATVADGDPVLAIVTSFNLQAEQSSQSTTLVLAQSLPVAIEYFGQSYPPLWTQDPTTPDGISLVQQALNDADMVFELLESVDKNITSALEAKGGEDLMLVGSLAYRQTFASTIDVWDAKNSRPLSFLKEISSGSDLSTMDVIYPASPLFLYTSPSYLLRLLIPVLDYSLNRTDPQHYYPYPWAPHHLGKYPVADIVPQQQENMPIEESGNFLHLLAILGHKFGGVSFLDQDTWPLLETWAQFLNATTRDPPKQLCSDDFEGPEALDANLAIKGMVGMMAYADLLLMKGDSQRAQVYMNQVQQYVAYWQHTDLSQFGTFFSRTYPTTNESDSWSTKYNLFYQYALNYTTSSFSFPASTAEDEIASYLSLRLNRYGIPLDNRATFTKGDWQQFIASLASQDQFLTILATTRDFLNTSPSRVPFTDWWDTITGIQRGFRCRAVVGAMFARMLL